MGENTEQKVELMKHDLIIKEIRNDVKEIKTDIKAGFKEINSRVRLLENWRNMIVGALILTSIIVGAIKFL